MRFSASILLLLASLSARAQVDEIKKKSTENSNHEASKPDRGSSSGNVMFFFDVFRIVGSVQADKLQKADSIKRLVSLETFFQGAVQPSSYYLMNPRIRGNWGLFSTDFRFNYLIEDDHANGIHDLSSFDWQIIELNLITTRNVTGRIGGGNMYERFGGHQSFFEWTAGFTILSNSQLVGGTMEYRVAKDYNTNMVPRREINFHVEKQFFQSKSLHGYFTLGAVYQRYYESISVWGLQAGLTMRIF